MNISISHRAIHRSSVLLLAASFVAGGCTSDDDDFTGPDVTAPSVLSFVQNRTLDTTGQTLSLTFSEAVTALTAEVPGSYTVSGGLTVNSATLRQAGNVIDLALDGPVLPGANTVSVAAGIEDAAGNASAEVMTAAITSTDVVAPGALTIAGATIAGLENDTINVVFDDDMIEAEVETAGSWTIESPLGTPFNITGASIDYVAATRTATVVLDAGSADQNLRTGDEIYASFTGMRDLAGNVITATSIGSTAISAVILGDSSPPTILAAAIGAGDTLVLTFSEAVRDVETADLLSGGNPTGTEFILSDASNGGATAAPTLSAVGPSGLRVTVTYGLTPDLADSLRIYGVIDLAGNQMSPELSAGLTASNANEPAINNGTSAATSIAGPDNDTILLEFVEPIHPFGLTNPSNYTVSDGGGAIDITDVRLAAIGSDGVALALGGALNLQTGQSYTLTADGLRSRQGVPTSGPVSSGAVVAVGDVVAPTVSAGDVRLDSGDPLSVLVEFSEAVAATSASAANFVIAGNTTDAAALVLPRVMRVTFQSAPAMGEDLDILVGGLTDLAGNAAGAPASVAIDGADVVAPTISSIAATAGATAAHSFEVNFSEPVIAAGALDPANYAVVTVGSGVPVDLTSAGVTLDSTTNRVSVLLPFGNYLDPGETLRVTTSNVSDVAGNVVVVAASDAVIGGDMTAPSSATAFVNRKLDAAGRLIEVTFDDAMNVSTTTTVGAWSGSGGQAAVQVLSLNRFRFRVTLDAAIGASETLSVTTPTDVSNNVGATLVVDPAE